MDIVAINNQVVLMRGAMKQAKLHTIRKMSRQAKSLRSKKGNEEQMTKNKRKADRLVKEISVIKELNSDNVSRFALTNSHTLKTLPKEMFGDLPVFCMTKLAEHKAVVLAVNGCRKKFSNWEKELPQLLKMCEIRKMFKLTHQPPGKSRRRNKVSPHKNFRFGPSVAEPGHKNQEWNSDHYHLKTHVDESGACIAVPEAQSDHHAEEYDCSDDNRIPLNNHSSSSEEFSNDDTDQSDTGSTSHKRSKVLKKTKIAPPVGIKELIQEHKEKPVVIAEKRVGDMEVRRFILSEIQESPSLNDEESLPKISTNLTPSNDNKQRKPKCRDSFFIGNTDGSLSEDDMPSAGSCFDSDADESKSTHPILESTFIGSLRNEGKDIFPPHHRKPNKLPIRNRETKYGTPTTGRSSERQQFVRNNDLHYPKQQPNRQQRRHQLLRAQKPAALMASNQASLHPSWDAKRKLKLQSQIHQFQGKKIKFDD